jgi:non-specific serine/threonine protein kinase/serine/threonine-protein kinase
MGMTREEWRRVKSVAAAAWDQPAARRAAFLDAACGGDHWLRQEAGRLLESSDAAATLYETPALSGPGVIAALDEMARAQPVVIGSRVGPYRIERELGRGGMGGVYLGERVDGEFDHRVAIKFVGNVASPGIMERFRQERRILATLDHPNVARLLDGGTSSSGVPYVVMEYVDGAPIDEYCSREQLSVRGKLELFRAVCGAVHHAHRRLIVHRDIKASNILVTPAGAPKLLDFGIAKIVEPQDATAVTALRALTPESASPEQVRGEPITIAADVYALGVLLYRLLTGRSPYGDVRNDHELMRAICERLPDPPRIDRDLDLIVLAALRKEPDRRYGSVDHLSADLARYLNGEPVLAAPDSASYRARKFVARHRVSVAIVGIAMVAVVAGGVMALWQAGIARRERARAETRLGEVRRLAGAFIFDFHDAISELPGALEARKLVASRAAEYLDRLAGEASQDDVALARELAAAYQRLGDILGGGGTSNLGDFAGAAANYEKALALREALASRAEAEATDLEALAELQVLLSRARAVQGDLAGSEQFATAAVATLERPLAVASTSPTRVGFLATSHHQLGFVQARRGQRAAALQSLERATAYAREQFQARPDARESARLARIESDYAEQLLAAGKPLESLDLLRSAQRTVDDLLAKDPLHTRNQVLLQMIFGYQGSALESIGNHGEAVAAYESALAIAERMSAAAPQDEGMHYARLLARYRLGMGRIRGGDAAAGIRDLRQAIADGEAQLTRVPGHDYSRHQVASARLELGETLYRLNPLDREACGLFKSGLTGWDDLASRGRLPGESARYRPKYEALLARCAGR